MVVPNGIPVDQFQLGSEIRQRIRNELEVEDKFVWLAVGRLEAPKDYPNLLHAMHAFSTPRNILLIAGDGPSRASMEQLASTLGISSEVRFLGTRTDVPRLMAAADAYVMASAWEGLPMGLLEASASALPIVATDVGGNHEIVRDRISGELWPQRKTPRRWGRNASNRRTIGGFASLHGLGGTTARAPTLQFVGEWINGSSSTSRFCSEICFRHRLQHLASMRNNTVCITHQSELPSRHRGAAVYFGFPRERARSG